jgi:hypothetical protein
MENVWTPVVKNRGQVEPYKEKYGQVSDRALTESEYPLDECQSPDASSVRTIKKCKRGVAS